jgi:pimeloyl-ACP methyl ester carboxylesterase
MTEELLNHPLIAGRYFFPQRGNLDAPFWIDAGDARLACSYHEIDPAAKTLIHFHGNGEIVDDYLGSFVAKILACGCNCLLAEYRGYGLSSGSPLLGRMLEDVTPVIRALGKPANELIFFGRSVGSLFALEAARLFPQAAGLILESGIADLLQRLLVRVTPAELGVSAQQLEQLVRRRFNPRQVLQDFSGPLLVMHCLHDDLVGVEHGRQLYAWGREPKTLKLFPLGDHNSIMFANFEEYFAAVAAFIAARA